MKENYNRLILYIILLAIVILNIADLGFTLQWIYIADLGVEYNPVMRIMFSEDGMMGIFYKIFIAAAFYIIMCIYYEYNKKYTFFISYSILTIYSGIFIYHFFIFVKISPFFS